MPWRTVGLALRYLTRAVLLCAGLVALYWFLLRHPATQPPGPALSQVDQITIVLGALTAVLTALAIVLAVAGAVGYVTIKDAATAAAESKAEQVARSVAAEVARTVASDVAPRVAETAATISSGRSEAAGNRIAEAAGNEDGGGS